MLDLIGRSCPKSEIGARWSIGMVVLGLMSVLAGCGTGEVNSLGTWQDVVIDGSRAYAAEAELLATDGTFIEGADPNASAGRFLTQPMTAVPTLLGTEFGSLDVVVDEPGEYTLWVRVLSVESTSDTAYLGLDGAVRPVSVGRLADYAWLEVERKLLDRTRHRISLGHTDPGLRIDLFVLVAADGVVPGDLEDLVVPPPSLPGEPGEDDFEDPVIPLPPVPGDGDDEDRVAPSLRGDPSFEVGSLTGDAALWYARVRQPVQDMADRLDPMNLAATDDTYTYGRALRVYVQAVLVAFRLTGDLVLLDHVDMIAERMRQELRDGWRDTRDGTDGTRDGYLNWVWRHSTYVTYAGKDTHRMDEMMTHGLVALIAYALDQNRDLPSPSGRDYAAHADFWKDYLVNHFEAKWRERTGVRTGFPIMIRPLTHPYHAWMKYHYYMWKLTDERGYLDEANRMADVLWGEYRSVELTSGPAYLWAHGVLGEGARETWVQTTVYAGYVYGDIIDLHLEGFHRWASAESMARFARTLSELVIDVHDPVADGFAVDIGGGEAWADLDASGSTQRMTVGWYGRNAYAFVGAWDAGDQLDNVTQAAWSDRPSTILAAGRFLGAWMDGGVATGSLAAASAW